MRDIRSIVCDYENAWTKHGPQDFFRYAMTQLAEALEDSGQVSVDAQRLYWAISKADLELRWFARLQSGTNGLPARPKIEDYIRLLKRSPAAVLAKIQEDSTKWQMPVSFIEAEMRIRWRCGERVQPSDFVSRFPALGFENVERLKQIAAELSRETLPPQEDEFGFMSSSQIDIQSFASSLVRCGVVCQSDVEEAVKKLPCELRTSAELARSLKQRKKLTPYQARSIIDGGSIPLTIGDYLICDEIGHGGMGQVYRAIHRRMDRAVAIKVILPEIMSNTESIKRFEREVKAAAKLTHPNIVVAFDAGEFKGTHYLVMEYVEGHNLASLVVNEGPLPVAQAIDCTLQVARALAFAHEKGIVHRDVKPANLLLTTEKSVKLLDLGLARVECGHGSHLSASWVDELTRDGAFMGTVDYMAPEQACDVKLADARSDIYSLGCTLYFLLTGRPMYEADTLTMRILAHREKPIPKLAKHNRNADIPLQRLLERMVAKKASDRFQSMSDVVECLEAAVSRQQEKLKKELAVSDPTIPRRELLRQEAVTTNRQQSRPQGSAIAVSPVSPRDHRGLQALGNKVDTKRSSGDGDTARDSTRKSANTSISSNQSTTSQEASRRLCLLVLLLVELSAMGAIKHRHDYWSLTQHAESVTRHFLSRAIVLDRDTTVKLRLVVRDLNLLNEKSFFEAYESGLREDDQSSVDYFLAVFIHDHKSTCFMVAIVHCHRRWIANCWIPSSNDDWAVNHHGLDERARFVNSDGE